MEQASKTQEEVVELIKEKRYQLDFDLDIPDEFKTNREVLATVLEHGNLPIAKLSEDLFKDREFLKLLVEKCANSFGEFPEWVRDDEEMARLALANNRSAFEVLSTRLKNDLGLLKLAISADCQNFGRMPEKWRDNKELITTLLAGRLVGNLCFDCLPPEYRDDREIALKALSDDASCFQHLSERLRDDRELATMAIGDRGYTLQHTSERLRDDKDVVLLARNDAGMAWEFVSERLKQDPVVVAAYVSENAHIMQKLSPEMRANPQVIEACLQSCNGTAYGYFSEGIRGNRDIALKMSAWSGFSLEDAPGKFREDKEIVANAVKSSRENFKNIGPGLMKEDGFLKSLVLLNQDLLQVMDRNLKERLFTTTLESSAHHERTIFYEMVVESPGIVSEQQRLVGKGSVSLKGRPEAEIHNFPAITYEEDGPVGSYLTERFINNFVLCGAFQFFVKKNSGQQTLINTLKKRYEGMIAYEEKIAPNDDFLKHEVYLVPDGSLEISYENLSVFPRIYWGRMENLPRGIQLLPSAESYREAFSVLTQKQIWGTPQFIRIDDSTLRAVETDVDEVFGAARVYVDDYGWRFLIPHAEGALKSLEVLKATTDADDWAWIKSRPSAELDARRKELLAAHFAGVPFAAEVAAYCES